MADGHPTRADLANRHDLVNGLAYAAERTVRDTREWYAVVALQAFGTVDRLMLKDDKWNLVFAGARLGALQERVYWKFRHESAALAGYRVAERQHDGRSVTARAKRQKSEIVRRVIRDELVQLVREDSSLGRARQDAKIARLMIRACRQLI